MRRLLLFLFVVFAVVFAVAAPASAEAVLVNPSTVVKVSPLVLAFVIGSVVPLVTAVAARLKASSPVKALLNLVLCIAGGVLAAFQANPGGLTWLQIAQAVIATYLASGVTYSHLWKPTGVAPAIQRATRSVGIG